MIFSKSFGYAIRSILYVAIMRDEKRYVQVEEIASKLSVPRHFMGKIMKKLAKEKEKEQKEEKKSSRSTNSTSSSTSPVSLPLDPVKRSSRISSRSSSVSNKEICSGKFGTKKTYQDQITSEGMFVSQKTAYKN